MKPYRIIIGLGNPDPLLANTYHNVGTMALDVLTKDLSFKPYKGIFEHVTAADGTVYIKPLVFMNDSGKAAREAAKMFGIESADITVIHDDSDLPVGEVKFSRGQSAAGHRGVQSVIDALKTKEFGRVRIGIRSKNERRRKKASEFVLKPIKTTDKKVLSEIFREIEKRLLTA